MASIDISNVVDQQGLVDKICSTVIDQQINTSQKW